MMWRVMMILMMVGVIAACEKQEARPPKPGPTASTQPDWPLFRGNRAMTGVAEGSLPHRLKLKWRYGTNSELIASPVVADGRLFIGDGDGRLHAIDARTGTRLWTMELGDAIDASATVIDDTVYVGDADGRLHALNVADGAKRWQYATDDKIAGAPNWFDDASGRRHIVVGSYDYRMHCVAATTGNPTWIAESGYYIHGSAAVLQADSRTSIVYGGCDGILRCLDGTGVVRWTLDVGGYVAGNPTVYEDRAYLGTFENQVFCVNLADGAVVWKYDAKQPFYASPAVDDKLIVIGSRDKRVHALDRTSGQVAWTTATRGPIDGSAVICGDEVVLGSTDGHLYILRLADGSVRWSYDVGEAITSSPAVASGRIIVADEGGTVWCFGAE